MSAYDYGEIITTIFQKKHGCMADTKKILINKNLYFQKEIYL